MPLSFPASPAIGATSTQNGRQYVYAGNNAWELVAASGSGEDSLLRSLFVPPAPTGVSASAGNAQATVSWTAPSGVIAQAPVTDYAVQFQPAGGSWQTFTDGTSTATSATVTGLTNGTAYTFRVAATNAVGTGSYSTASSAVTPNPAPTDPYFSSVSLLLHGDGNLDDSSSYDRTVSTTGTVSTAGAARYGSASIGFSGSGRIAVPSDSSLTFDGDFTIECWVQFSAKPSNYIALFAGSSGATQMFLTTKVSGNGLRWGLSATAEYASGDFTWATGTWYHVAVRRASNAVTLWVGGTNITTGTPTNGTTYTGGMNLFGGIGSVDDFTGLVDEFRITKGVSRTITVPTAAFPDS
jgi:hypothetical protein